MNRNGSVSANRLPRLPIGIQSFETIRENSYLYVDKTEHIFRMVDEGMFYFLARPRRFGKSLLVSTLKCLFQGRKELFSGLRIEQHGEWNWKAHPVIAMDFNQIPHDTPKRLEKAILLDLDRTAAEHDLLLKTPFMETRFGELITGLHQKSGSSVVILVDEYDKPLIDHLGKGEAFTEIAKQNREIQRRLFGVLKGVSVAPALRFVLLTGVSKFSRVSLFSELNNLDDISMSRFYAEMLGYTDRELTSCFGPHIDRFAGETGMSREEILGRLREQYNGYRFSATAGAVYNPFSVLKSLHHREFHHYWFETGTPAFLVNLLQEKAYPIPEIENMAVDEQVFSTFDLDNLKPEAILFQTGYVTIKGIEDGLYRLDYPNGEVKTAFLKHLMFVYAGGISGEEKSRFLRLSKHLREADFPSFFETVSAIFASIPYAIESKRDEAYFHTLFYLMVSASGMDARSEVLNCRGRIDLVLALPGRIFLMEFKCNQSAAAGIAQIREKGYADPYRGSQKKLFLVGIDFSTEKRNVAEWKVETEGMEGKGWWSSR